jgi:hypothetical protein
MDFIDCDGEIELVAAVLRRIHSDLRSRNRFHRRAAQAWLDGANGSIRQWAEIIGIEPNLLRARLLKKE